LRLSLGWPKGANVVAADRELMRKFQSLPIEIRAELLGLIGVSEASDLSAHNSADAAGESAGKPRRAQ
jgi:hypothetical protein